MTNGRKSITVKHKYSDEQLQAVTHNMQKLLIQLDDVPKNLYPDITNIVVAGWKKGRDLGGIIKGIERLGYPNDRSVEIGRFLLDASSIIDKIVKMKSIGINYGIWECFVIKGYDAEYHPEHLKAAADGIYFDLNKGANLGGQYVFPGQMPKCECGFKAILPGTKDEIMAKKELHSNDSPVRNSFFSRLFKKLK